MELAEHLNPSQLKAARHVQGPMLVIAGAGSGKTRVVTYRIAHLIQIGVPSSEILAVTFTNKAADEMRMRIHNLTQRNVLASTFHSLGARILRESITPLGYRSHFAIFDEEDSEKVLKECFKERGLKIEKGLVKEARIAISSAKNQMVDIEDELLSDLYSLYQKKLLDCNALDFDDLLFLTVKLFRQEPEILAIYQKRWIFILVDEYQDTNQAQYTLLKLLSAQHQNVFAVGDPDQSIYSWRGANIGNILKFEEDYPGAEKISLEENYRSSQNILNVANSLIQHNQRRYEKNLHSNRGIGEQVGIYLCDFDREEVTFVLDRLYHHHQKESIPLSNCVIFYRTHFQSRLFEDALLRENIPYRILGGISFYMRREIKDILAFLRVAIEGRDFLSFSRTINLPKRGIGPAAQGKIRALEGDDLIQKARDALADTAPFSLSNRQKEGLDEYIQTISSLRQLIASDTSISEILKETISLSHYKIFLKEDPDTEQDRLENLEEVISKAAEWEEENEEGTLAAFLEDLSLKGNPEDPHDRDRLSLMTLHNGKGLEFDVAFLVGMEEGLFPHANSLDDFDSLEEERRLCYVGMTRAHNFLYLSATRTRRLWGSIRRMRPSRFLAELPKELLKKYHKDILLSEEVEAVEGGFAPGDQVNHRDFGTGVVQKVYSSSLGLTYDILFPESGQTKSLVGKYAKLAKI